MLSSNVLLGLYVVLEIEGNRLVHVPSCGILSLPVTKYFMSIC